MNILSPIAIRFGFNNLKEELESHAFAFLYPNEYQEILSWLDDKYPQRQQLIEELTEDLKIDLEDENLLQNIKIYPREKSIYSIYKKKQARNVSLNNILDVIGFRLITKTKEDCYAALAVVQNIGTYFKGEGVLKEAVRDYIDAPKKSTGYQSIHINIHYEYQNLKCIVEFQIRTEGMHLAAEYGIEAFGLGSVSHLQYKEPEHYAHPSSKKNYELRERATSEKKLIIKCSIESLKSLEKFLKDSQLEFLSLDDIDKTSDDLVFLKIGVIPKDESTSTDSYSLISQLHKAIGDKINLFSTILISDPSNKEESSNKEEEDNVLKTRLGLSLEEKAILIKELSSLPSESTSDIYVITPKGDILKLPNGSCCIDFAYAIHSDLGDSCSGAKVNEQIVKLETKLNNGDRVEITRQNNSFPSKDWLSFVKTSKAKHRIKRWLKRSKWSEHIAKGRELLRDKLKFNEKIDLTLDSQEMLRIAEKFNYRDMNSLFAALSYGEKTVDEILSKIRECYPKKTKSSTQKKLKEEKSQSNQQNQLIIEGQQNQLIIEGHTRIEYRLAKCCCPTIGQSIIGIIPQRSRWISVHTKECKNWQHVPESRQIKVWWHSIQMTLKTHDEIGVLGQLGLIAEKANINLQQGSFITHLDNTATFNISIQYNNNKQFETFKREIESMEKYISMDSKPAISLKTSTTSTPR